jgi:hypothetical protein
MNVRSLTGRFASGKARRAIGFESSLERDLEVLLEFDPRVLDFEEQPVHVAWRSPDGKPHVYTPDFLVTYTRFDPARDPQIKCLVEVKYRFDLVKNLAQYRLPLKAALAYAADRGWRFKILTDFEIRGRYLRPARFLLPFLRDVPDHVMEALVLEAVARQAMHPPFRPTANAVASDLHDRAERGDVLRSLWRLVAVGRLRMDFAKELTTYRKLWIPDPREVRPLLLPLALPGLYQGQR